MKHDYSTMVLEGEGETDYARYMRTDDLLSLQRKPEEMVHRDELLFQTVHQSTELWLKLACFEARTANEKVQRGELEAAESLMGRGSHGIQLITQQLEMLTFLTPADFQLLRTVLGNGSGFESPGWQSVHDVSLALNESFEALLSKNRIDLAELYMDDPHNAFYRLAEAMVEWDERIALWRVRHFQVAIRTIGINAVGTKGTPVDQLYKLITRKYFPNLWRVRSELTLASPLGDLMPAETEEVA